MTFDNRRDFLRMVAGGISVAAAVALLPDVIRKALSIEADRRSGTLMDVEHIVILMQENRSFDHYFGTLGGVRGFGDRFPIPLPNAYGLKRNTVWYQTNDADPLQPQIIAPFHLNTRQNFEYMRVMGTPHAWLDAQGAWNNGIMNTWPRHKHNHSMGYFTQDDLPFQYALANTFTLCDAYHCSFHGGTNTNRLFLWSGTNDPHGKGNGPATYNDYDWFDANPGNDGGYNWTTYPERLEEAGITWQVYENMKDNYTDNPLAGFHRFRDAWFAREGHSASLKARGVSTRDLDKLKEDVLNDRLPQVSWIVATAEGSEHPDASSPAQGADYTARVLDALTANPEVWSKTVFIVNFDENDGFFDHVPPPSVPAYESFDADPAKAVFAGASSVDTSGEYHEIIKPYHTNPLEQTMLNRAYGLGPRVPLYVISPWSKGGWVNSEVFDHTSVIRFIEKRFGVIEPNISSWRRAVCGDLCSTLNFKDPDDTEFFKAFPSTVALAERARALSQKTTPPTPSQINLPSQALLTRPSRALPYELHTDAKVLEPTSIELAFRNTGSAASVFHVYDRLHLDRIPHRYTVEAGKTLLGQWELSATQGRYDLWVLAPNGFHRHFCGNAATDQAELSLRYDRLGGHIVATITNTSPSTLSYTLSPNAYYSDAPISGELAPQSQKEHRFALESGGYWYDFTLEASDGFIRRFAGRMETGKDSISDPAMGGEAIGTYV